jgi:hypothetical protein
VRPCAAARDPDAVERFFEEVLGLSEYPDGFSRDYQVAYRPEPSELVIEFEKAKYRFDALAGIDSRPDLLKMDWYRFENLIRQLFEAMGMEVRVT